MTDALMTFRETLAKNLDGAPAGIVSVCSAHPLVLDAALARAARDGTPVLIEATCNQVNQDGGYIGQTPAAFRDALFARADAAGVSRDAVLLGGDHLGPNPWRHMPAAAAMARAKTLVEAYARAGYQKLHLDASMVCADDPPVLPAATIAARAADLARIAEAAAPSPPVYVVGTEVPTPGGARDDEPALHVTEPTDVRVTLDLHRAAFAAAGCAPAMERVVAIVVQPGVEFSQHGVEAFDPVAARRLSALAPELGGAVFEAHSTDYQTGTALAGLVRGHFAILKVGPQLTWALREAAFALDAIAAELTGAAILRPALDRAMDADPRWWRGYVAADDRVGRSFGLSDRVRYYWPAPAVATAWSELLRALSATVIPWPLLAQVLPFEAALVRAGALAAEPVALLTAHVDRVLATYAAAAGSISAR